MTTVRELLDELNTCAPDAKVVIATREEYLGSINGFGIGLYTVDDDKLDVARGTVVLREVFG